MNQQYWYNSIKPDKLMTVDLFISYVSCIYNVKYEYTNCVVYLETQESGKVYNYENEYIIHIKNVNLKMMVCESFYSYSMNTLDDPKIRGLNTIQLKFIYNENEINDDIKLVLFNFSNKLNNCVKSRIDAFQQEYDTKYYWENPSYYESDGTEPVPETIANRTIITYTQLP